MPGGAGDLARLTRWLDALPSGVAADARLLRESWQTMRFANGEIHQPHEERDASLSLRVYVEGRLGVATSGEVTPEGFRRLTAQATALARVAPPEPKFPGFPTGRGTVRPVARAEGTARLSVEAAVRLASEALDAAQAEIPGARVSGVVNVGAQTISVANSAGLARATDRTVAQAQVLVEQLATERPGSGWAEGAHWDAARLDTAALARRAAARVARAPPRAVAPGPYRVVLGSAAVAEMLTFFAHLGFNGHGELEGWSCLARRRGRRIAPTGVTITDDGRSPSVLPQAIDFEGLPKRRHAMVDRGIARGPVMDLVTAGRLGTSPTGHGLPPESPWGDFGPVPCHVVMAPGDASEAELVRSVRRGILVTRLHYVRVVHPAQSMLTGMTRDGTYLIEKGEVVAPVRNLRFTESVLRTLAGTELIGRATHRVADERGFASVSCPELVARSFRFTSATLF